MSGIFELINFQPPKPPLQGLSSRLLDYCGLHYLYNETPETEWLFRKSLALGDVSVLAGLPGVGKNYFTYQAMVHLSAGLDFLRWQVEDEYRCRTFCLTGEESSGDVHQKVRAALLQIPEEHRAKAAASIHAISVNGDVGLVTTDRYGRIAPSDNYFYLDELLGDLLPRFFVLDTLARFFPVNENDNASLTQVFSLLEQLATKHQTTIMVSRGNVGGEAHCRVIENGDGRCRGRCGWFFRRVVLYAV